MNTKNNQRYRETEIRMDAAMLELMKHTEFEKITVKKICETAGVNRSTFYAHFTDIYDMLDRMEDFCIRSFWKAIRSTAIRKICRSRTR